MVRGHSEEMDKASEQMAELAAKQIQLATASPAVLSPPPITPATNRPMQRSSSWGGYRGSGLGRDHGAKERPAL